MLERTDLERTHSEILGRVEAGAQHLCADGRAKESGSERASARHVGLGQGLAAIGAVAWFVSSICSHHSHDEGGELEEMQREKMTLKLRLQATAQASTSIPLSGTAKGARTRRRRCKRC